MPVISTQKDPDQLTLTVVTEHTATPERVWQLWADPRQLERWWARRPGPRRSIRSSSSLEVTFLPT